MRLTTSFDDVTSVFHDSLNQSLFYLNPSILNYSITNNCDAMKNYTSSIKKKRILTQAGRLLTPFLGSKVTFWQPSVECFPLQLSIVLVCYFFNMKSRLQSTDDDHQYINLMPINETKLSMIDQNCQGIRWGNLNREI